MVAVGEGQRLPVCPWDAERLVRILVEEPIDTLSASDAAYLRAFLSVGTQPHLDRVFSVCRLRKGEPAQVMVPPLTEGELPPLWAARIHGGE